MDAAIPAPLLAELEGTAVELARLAGAEIQTALGRVLAVRYKREAPMQAAPTDPVSEVDHQVEVLIRARLGERFPDHAIIGEEIDEGANEERAFTWVVDPIDGTANFVNGFPLFAACIGVLHQGRPVVGALWCSTSHAVRAGIYHAREGGPLCFEGEPLATRRNPEVRRHLVGEPRTGGGADGAAPPWDVRVTGSAAIECAFVAAGLLRAARFERPNIWDVGGGVALVRAAGLEARWRGPQGWAPLERFAPPDGTPEEPAGLRRWHGSVAIGEREAVEALCRVNP
jgi:myo-inositol-1(or 4)-monophosphatase